MQSFAFFFNAKTFEDKRRLVRAGEVVRIDYVASAARLPFKSLVRGDELFIVGIDKGKVRLAGRLVCDGPPVSLAEARHRAGHRDLLAKDLVCFADPEQVDVFRADLLVPDEIARDLNMFTVSGDALSAASLRMGEPDANLFRSCPRLAEESAVLLRELLGCNQLVTTQDIEPEISIPDDGVDDDAYRLRAIKTRRGQNKFRRNVLEAYGARCVVTECRVEDLLEAAHITAHAELTDYRVSNGLPLRADIHTLFDLDLIGIDEHYRVCVSPLIRNSEYWRYDGRRLGRLPDKTVDQPDREALRRRYERLRRDPIVA